MTYTQILKEIQQKKFHPMYFLHGMESYFIDKIADSLENEVLNESEKAFNLAVLYGKEIDFRQVVDYARQFPMMASHRLVVIKEAQEMRSINQLESYVIKPSPQTIVVFCYKYKKLDKRTKFGKAMSKHGFVFESKKLYDNQLPDWIRGQIADSGYKIKGDALQLLVEYLGSDLSRISNELKKLAINLSKSEEINTQLIEENIGISKDYNVFELQKAIGQKNISKISRILKYFQENAKSHPLQLVVGSLYQYLVKVLITKSNPGLNDYQLQSVLKIASSYFAKDYKMAASNYSISQIKNLILALRKVDHQSKGINSKNLKEGAIYKELLVNIMMS